MLAQKATGITSSSWQRITANDNSLIKYFFSKPGPILTLWQKWQTRLAFLSLFFIIYFFINIISFFLSLSSKNFAVCRLSFQIFGHYNIAPRITRIIFRPKVIWPTRKTGTSFLVLSEKATTFDCKEKKLVALHGFKILIPWHKQ